jgi:hypothetical protein
MPLFFEGGHKNVRKTEMFMKIPSPRAITQSIIDQ